MMHRLMDRFLPALLLSFCFACSGGGSGITRLKKQPKVPPVPVAETEFKATLAWAGQQHPIEVSTKRQKFRLEKDGKVYIGDLEGKLVWALNTESKTCFRYEKGRESSLFKTHGRPGATRYRDAVNGSMVGSAVAGVRQPFLSPCEAATKSLGQHRICNVVQAGPDLKRYTHEFHRRLSMQEGFKEKVSTTDHLYNTRLGVLVGGSYGHFLDIQEQELPAERFQVPEDYRELLSDEDLADPRFQYIGKPDMVDGLELEPFMEFFLQYPPPPAEPQWIYQIEKWWVKGQSRKFMFIERAYPVGEFDPTQLPIKVDYKIQVEKWDETPEVGEFSYRHEKGPLTFYGGGQIIKLTAAEKTFGDDVALAKKLLELTSRERSKK